MSMKQFKNVFVENVNVKYIFFNNLYHFNLHNYMVPGVIYFNKKTVMYIIVYYNNNKKITKKSESAMKK